MSRTAADIESDFRQQTGRAGYIQFQIFQLSKDLELVNEQLRELNTEGLKAVQAEKEAAAKAAIVSEEAPSV